MTARPLLAAFALTLAPFAAHAAGPSPLPPDPVVVSPAPAPAPRPDYDFTGFSLGAQVGYASADEDGAIGGVRAGYDFPLGQRALAGVTAQYDATGATLDNGQDLDSLLRVGARLGLTSNRNWYYATGGFARADAGDTADGYFVGLGYEVFLTDRVTAGAEALYNDFDDGPVEGDATSVEMSVNFRF